MILTQRLIETNTDNHNAQIEINTYKEHAEKNHLKNKVKTENQDISSEYKSCVETSPDV